MKKMLFILMTFMVFMGCGQDPNAVDSMSDSINRIPGSVIPPQQVLLPTLEYYYHRQGIDENGIHVRDDNFDGYEGYYHSGSPCYGGETNCMLLGVACPKEYREGKYLNYQYTGTFYFNHTSSIKGYKKVKDSDVPSTPHSWSSAYFDGEDGWVDVFFSSWHSGKNGALAWIVLRPSRLRPLMRYRVNTGNGSYSYEFSMCCPKAPYPGGSYCIPCGDGSSFIQK